MKTKVEFSYNGERQERKAPVSLLLRVAPMQTLGMVGEYRCACAGMTSEPLGILYYGNQSNPEWIVTLSWLFLAGAALRPLPGAITPKERQQNMKRELTEEQKAKSAARKAAFRELWRKVAAAPELERVKLANKLGLRTCEGHELSLCNTMLVALQNPTASVLGGFRQWLKQGRAVRKGQHGCMIWVPIGSKAATPAADSGTAQPANGEATDETRFIIGTLFDIAQTEEIETQTA